MACITLKRRHEFDPLSLTPKRRKLCSAQTYIPAPIKKATTPFVPSSSLTSDQLNSHIRDEVRRLQRRRLIPKFDIKSAQFAEDQHNSSSDSDSDGLTVVTSHPDTAVPVAQESPMQMLECLNSQQKTDMAVETLSQSGSSRAQVHTDVPLFTLKQVGDICQRLVKEREGQLKEEYEKILSCKLSEQYEAFLKFNHDHLYRQFQNAPMSYVS